jgi:hypothetical protein
LREIRSAGSARGDGHKRLPQDPSLPTDSAYVACWSAARRLLSTVLEDWVAQERFLPGFLWSLVLRRTTQYGQCVQPRTGAIEIRKQEEYVKNCKPVSAREPRSRDEKTLAVLLGGAIGDAFGYEVKFDSIRSIRTRFGSAGITEPTFHDRKLVVSDDTQMTLFTLEGLVRALAGGRFSSNCAQSRFEWRTSTGWERSGKARSPRGGSPPARDARLARARKYLLERFECWRSRLNKPSNQ